MTRAAMALVVAAMAACSSGAPQPAVLDTRNDACASCRMIVSDARFAAQIVAPGEEPRFFDDIGCLSRYLQAQPTMPAGAAAFVADHRTGDWVGADRAVFTMVPTLETPMGSRLVAHASPLSRDADAAARGGTPVSRATISPWLTGAQAR